MCRTRNPRKGGGATKPPNQPGRTRKVQVVQEESAEDSDPLNTIVELSQVEGKSNSPVSLDGKPLCLEIDTGACVTIMSENTFNELLPQENLAQSKASLSTYSGERLKAKGECKVMVEPRPEEDTTTSCCGRKRAEPAK